MAKFVFELLDGYAETSLYLPLTGDLVLLFSPSLKGYVTVGDKAYEVIDGRVVIPKSVLPCGDFSAELVTQGKRWTLPRLVFDGESVIPKPYDDETVRELANKIRSLAERVEVLISEAKAIKEKVYGKLELL